MKKIVVLDTNVFLDDPKSIFSFKDTLVVIPFSVIEELDSFKKSVNDLGRNSREILRQIDKLRKENGKGALSKKVDELDINKLGIKLRHGGRLVIELNHIQDIPEGLDPHKVDNRIVAVARYYQRTFPSIEVTLISQDTNVRIKADAVGLATDGYETSGIGKSQDGLYKGKQSISVSKDDITKFDKTQKLSVKQKLHPNEFVILVNKKNDADNRLGRYDASVKAIVPLNVKVSKEIFSLTPNNAEQACALDLLLDPNIPLVTITGKAGTGKTLLAVAAGCQTTVEDGSYDKMLVSRPIMPLGKDIGYLPGTMEEKLDPWMQPIYDNLEFLFNIGKGPRVKKSEKHKELIHQGFIQVEPLTYIRGRSLPNQYMLIDEAQNLSIHEIKTIITRAGKGTKIVLTGDPEQIDNPYLDSLSNGLSQVIELLKDQTLTGHIHLVNGERSELAEMASEVLK